MRLLPYTTALRKATLEQLLPEQVTALDLPGLYRKEPNPYYPNRTEDWDKRGFADDFRRQLCEQTGAEVIMAITFVPEAREQALRTFAYLPTKQVAVFQVAATEPLQAWCGLLFDDFYDLAEGEADASGPFLSACEWTVRANGYSVMKSSRSESPFDKIGRRIYKEAPDVYHTERTAREKKRFIEKYADTAGADIDLSELHDAITTALAKRGFHPTPPSDNADAYAQFAEEAGYQIPPDLRTLLDAHGGIPGTGFLTAEGMLREWRASQEIYNAPDWMLSDLRANSNPDRTLTRGLYACPYYLPFLDRGAGDFLAVDLMPGSKGRSGQVIGIGPGEDKVRFVAQDLLAFFRELGESEEVYDEGLRYPS